MLRFVCGVLSCNYDYWNHLLFLQPSIHTLCITCESILGHLSGNDRTYIQSPHQQDSATAQNFIMDELCRCQMWYVSVSWRKPFVISFSNMVSTTPTGQAKYVQHNMEACSSNYSCCESSMYYMFWVCVRCPVCKAHAPYYSHLRPVSFYHIFLYYLINGSIFKVTEHKMCLLIFLTTFVCKHFSF